ncbi:ferritin-like domain-containing protein [Azospirillum thermophilum]|uniref:Rubrerythrin n=1 Tax=Azospirillum thermophilum TaxID=2202148 RepID=A0A2S2CTM6_9PROT|nr:ferritin family protein [Azospirillum thermophilum]AWK87765.1 rubrerythrin [Azospirillum thermophilum]
MKTKIQGGATGVGLFLAHAMELEREAAERYDELADSMEAHNNPEVAKLFRDLGGYSRKHAEEVRQIAEEYGPLPKVAPWEFDWGNATESPEAASFEHAHYLMRPHHALKMALMSEQQGAHYYASVAAETEDPDVARLAREFAGEEEGHVTLVRKWLERYPAPRDDWDEDPDPPNVAE